MGLSWSDFTSGLESALDYGQQAADIYSSFNGGGGGGTRPVGVGQSVGISGATPPMVAQPAGWNPLGGDDKPQAAALPWVIGGLAAVLLLNRR